MGDEDCRRVATRGQREMAPLPRKPRSCHREVKPIDGNPVLHKIVKLPEQRCWTFPAVHRMQRFGVNAVSHQSGADAMARHVAEDKVKEFVTLWLDNTEVTANRMRRAKVGFNHEVLPNLILWRQRLLNARSDRQFGLHFILSLL